MKILTCGYIKKKNTYKNLLTRCSRISINDECRIFIISSSRRAIHSNDTYYAVT